MGIEYGAKIFVGLPKKELPEEVRDRIEDYDLDMDQCEPYYDGCDAALIGYTLLSSGDYQACKFVYDQAEAEKLKARFKEETGLDAEIWLTPYGH